MLRTALLIAGLLVSLAAQPQEIYKWVDKDGVVHFADQPGAPGAELVPYRASGPPPADTAPPALYQSQPPQPPPGPAYRSLEILSPKPDEVFFGTDAAVVVQLALNPELRIGDKLIVFIDGERAPEFSGASTTLTGLSRGTHFLRAAVIDDAGSVVITSPQINFFLRQHSVLSPPTGPAVRRPATGNP